MRCVRLPWLALSVLLVLGCQQNPKVDLDYSFRLEPEDEKFVLLQATDKDEPVAVIASSNNVPIDLYILKAQSEDEATTIIRKQSAKDILASKLAKPNPRFDTTLIAHTRYVLAVASHRNANVGVKITSR